ncbi:hypothetical protein P7C70_g7994, partial [Phenoliferia sp. Uapishka_3]
MGGLNLHLPISFSDGVQWLARLPQSSPTSPPQVILDKSLLSETATYSLLQSVGVKVPRIHALEVGGSTPSFFLMDRLPGTPKFYEILSDPAARRRVIEDVADCFIAISTLPLAACGAPTFDTQGTVTIGPLVEPRWHQRAQDGSLKMLGPYKSAREKHIACIEVVLDRIKGGFQHVEDAEEVYLIHLVCSIPTPGQLSHKLFDHFKELIEIVKLLYPTGSATSFFLRHTDAKGDNWLIDESNHISGFIDWEWAEAASPHEAFAAPEAFFDVGAFYEGVNDLSYREQDLADALDRKSRSDLAAYVRNGKAYQRLPFLIGGSVDVDYFRMYQSLRSIVLGRVMERGEWLTMAREKFGADGGWKNLKG